LSGLYIQVDIYISVGTAPTSNRKSIERDKVGTANTRIYITAYFPGLVRPRQ